VTVAAAVQPSVVMLSDLRGTVIGSGFWILPNAIMTTWDAVGRQDVAIRVTINSSPTTTVPLTLDGVLAFSVPTLNIAVVLVNPPLAQDTAFVPQILPILAEVQAVGTTVVVAPNPGIAGLSTGVVAVTSYGERGYDTYLMLSGVAPGAVGGTPIFRARDLAVVGMVAFGTSAGEIGAVAGSSLRAAAQWAANSPILTTSLLVGATVPAPVFKGSLALGQAVDAVLAGWSPTPDPGTLITVPTRVYVPMRAEAVDPLASGFTDFLERLPAGVPANGSCVYDAALPIESLSSTPDVFVEGAFGQFVLPSPTYPNALAFVTYTAEQATAMNNEYVRSTYLEMPTLWADVTTTEPMTGVPFGESFFAVLDVGTFTPPEEPAVPMVAPVCVDGHGNYTTFRYVVVSWRTGVVGFTNANEVPLGFTIDNLNAFIANPSSATAAVLGCPVAAPFGAVMQPFDFFSGYYVYVAATTDPGTDTLTIAWSGFNDNYEPLEFAVKISRVRSDVPVPPTRGLVFTYATMPGAQWMQPWVVGTTLTLDPFTPEGAGGVVRVRGTPTTGDIIYFGMHVVTVQNLVYVPAPASLLATFGTSGAVGPARDSRGDINPLVVSGSVPVLSDVAGGFAWTVLVWDGGDGVILPAPRRVASVNGYEVGVDALNSPSLGDVLITAGMNATLATPVAVSPVTFYAVGSAAPVPLANPAAAVSRKSYLGYLPLVTSAMGGGITFTPATGAVYSAVLFSAPIDAATGLLPNFTSVSGIVAVPGALSVSAAAIVIIQLACSLSGYVDPGFTYLPFDGPTCAVLYYDPDAEAWVLETRRGLNGSAISTAGPFSAAQVVTGIPFTVQYDVGGLYTQRPNVLAVGRMPRYGNEPWEDPVADAALVTATVALTSAFVAPLVSTVVPDVGAYAVVANEGLEHPSPSYGGALSS
jgi:hypothetical protein